MENNEQEMEVVLSSQRLLFLYKQRSAELYEQNPDLYVSPTTAVREYWDGVKAAFLELVEENRINIYRQNPNMEGIWKMINARYFQNNRKTVNRKYKA